MISPAITGETEYGNEELGALSRVDEQDFTPPISVYFQPLPSPSFPTRAEFKM